MADSSPLDDLLDRAGKVFSLAGDLGREFNEEHRRQRQRGQIDPASWDRHAQLFNEFGEAVLGLQGAMENPPAGFGRVAEQLLKAASIAEGIWDTIQQPHGRGEATYLDFFSSLNSLSESGWQSIQEVTKVQRSVNPFSVGRKPPDGSQSDIDTTPTLPEPPAGFVEAAGRDIPSALADVEARHDGAIEMIASHLAKRLQNAGHTLAASYWAVHKAVRAGRLTPGLIEMELPSFGKTVGGAMGHWGGPNDRRMVWSGGQKGTVSIPKGKPAPFDNFKVTATESLWSWWRSIAEEPAGESPDAGEPPKGGDRPVEPNAIGPTENKLATNTKRSTPRGAATVKLIGAFTKWHDYANGSCLNLTPVGVRQLAALANVDPSTASDFFKREFKDYGKYEMACKDVHTLVAALKLLNDEFAPYHLLQAEPSDAAKDEDQ
jgi:hypothetical protein